MKTMKKKIKIKNLQSMDRGEIENYQIKNVNGLMTKELMLPQYLDKGGNG